VSGAWPVESSERSSPAERPRSLEQEPINIGDKEYDPLYAHGWGLTTKGH
jgi:beta-glucosidase